jgi:hypothetical protein
LTDELEDPAENAHIEGDDAAPVDAASRKRLSNYTQIFKKHAVVTGTQEKVLKGGGIKSEMAYQVARRMKAIKRDCEVACVGETAQGAGPKEAGDDVTAREMGYFESYMTATSWRGGAAGVAPIGNGVDAGTDGALRDFDEDILGAALGDLWENSGGNENIMAICNKAVRGIFSDFTASSTRYVTTDDRKLVASIDVYDGDFHTVTVTPDRFTALSTCILLDPEYVQMCDLRPISSKDLAVLGDSTRKEIVWETTLEVCNPDAHMFIDNLNFTAP